ncbi:hypothetical protein RM572_22445 [Streptomyces sp. DSM 42041]|uniref:DUF2970 domain-containing protein n=1 Tax=Streptomyces hazeniae TaxID=3075538 RepID=A0ABU2NX07_9ACTN|nr:hypothetical protein [Streptomyces sp. DSM 42041]MDT0381523.1 hypothetical protein [Streptomyces sp. DSM 42041]
MLTINVAVLLTVIVLLRLRRRTEPRTRFDETFGVVLVLVLGVLLAPTSFGQWVLDLVGQLAHGITRAGG